LNSVPVSVGRETEGLEPAELADEPLVSAPKQFNW
jgi:hypothetical protein